MEATDTKCQYCGLTDTEGNNHLDGDLCPVDWDSLPEEDFGE